MRKNLSTFNSTEPYFNGAFCTFDKYLASKKKNKSIRNLETLLSDNNLLNDLCFFEGNAQNIRILNSLIYTSRSGFSKALFRAIGKYTSDIDTYLANKNVDTSTIKIENKKLGYYKSEEKIAEIIFKDFNSKRSFLAYLVEASDDIAYSISDLEDSLSKNLISVEQLKNEIISEYKKINSIEETAIKEIFSSENYNGGMFLRLLKKHPYEGSEDLYARIKKNEDRKGYYNNIILLIDAYLTEKNKNEELSNKRLDYTINAIKKAKYYRGQESYELERIENVIRGYLISSSTEYFKYYFKSLVEGKYEFGSIVNNCSCNFIHSAIVKCMEKYVYNSELVRNKEIIAMKIIDTIMTNLFNTILNIDLPKEYKNKLYEQFEYLLGKKHLNAYYKSIQKCSSKNTENTIANIIYYKVRLLIDTVSAMTDSYALFIYQNMEAII